LKEINVNLRTLDGGMMTYKRRSMRRKNTINVYIITRVIKIYKNTKKCKENYERSKMTDIHGALSKIRYEK
jgi:hypothetical protein